MSLRSFIPIAFLSLFSVVVGKEIDIGSCFHSSSTPFFFRQNCDWRDEPDLNLQRILALDDTNPYAPKKPAELPDIVEPWSYKPYCAEPINGTETICLFTSLSFAGGRGISLITTPHDAKIIADTEAFNKAEVLEGVNVERNPPYEALSLPGRGIGLIANTTLRRGDLIFSHTPVVVVNEKVQQYISLQDIGLLQQGGVARLPEASRKKFLALHGHFGGEMVDDIINTNSFDVQMGKSKDSHYVVLPETSRLNHACRPNAHYYLDPDTLTHHVHAITDINPGEEITISYLDPSMSREDRMEKLKRTWGFDCNCSRCTQPRIFTDASDERLELIDELTEKLHGTAANRTATTEDAELLISLMKQERLHAVIADAYVYAALEYNYVGNKPKALQYSSLAVEIGLLYAGPKDDDVKYMQDLWEDPESHWSWRYMEKVRNGTAPREVKEE